MSAFSGKHPPSPQPGTLQTVTRAHEGDRAKAAESFWQQALTPWFLAWAANWAAFGLVQHTGATRFSPVKPQRQVVASSGHHYGPRGDPGPPVHNIVLTNLTTGFSARAQGTTPIRVRWINRAGVGYRDRMPPGAFPSMHA